ncbi:hypothetical protein [Pseudotamlana carrageenivorans]|uniref:Uncharacterized protein n=1 Tax=Pseudotamlana carrageenivorans TaxID=2069432 RepID=A0A2I7SKR7_9FLAO|nr:hypothetical protein [Tamlana carrageenivorans]AUS06457.1 hypothetical protein C1A40_13830 [Tamlana carrageenivorans]
MIPASKQQKQRIAILTKNDKEFKAALVMQYTNDATKNSTNDLTHAQANNIIEQLGGKPILYDNWAFFNKYNRSHKYLISLAMQFGMTIPNDKYGEICDLVRLSEWLKHKAPVKKSVLKMSTTEVSKTISALERMNVKQHS